jgi:hypothetical protein
MVEKREVVRLKHYTNHVFNRDTKQLYKECRGRYAEKAPMEGVYTINARGKQYNFTEEELMRSTQYVHTDNVKVSKHYAKHEKRLVW